MRIKGVQSGKMRGAPIELNPTEKAVEAVKEYVSKNAPENEVQYCENVNVKHISEQSKGPRTDGKTFAHNMYSAKGTVVVRRHNSSKDRLYPAQTKEFVVNFEDVLDGWGMPDIKVKDCKLE